MFGAVIYKYLIVFLVSMVPIVELRGAIPIAAGMASNGYILHYLCYWKYASGTYNIFVCKKGINMGSR